MALVAMASIFLVPGAHAVIVTAGTGAEAVSADKAANASDGGQWTTLSNVVIQESAGHGTDFAPNQTAKTLILTAPSGWQFNPGQGSVTNAPSGDITSASVVVAATTITVTFSTGSGNTLDTLALIGIQVKAQNGNAVSVTGYLTRSSSNPGTASVTGTTSALYATLGQTPGAPARLVITLPGQTFAAGTGNTGTASAQTAGSAFDLSKITAVDQFGNIATGYTGTKTLTYAGPASSPAPCNAAPTFTTSATFTSGQATSLSTTLTKAETTTISVAAGSVSGVSSSLTVNPGAATQVVVETEADGIGTVVPAQTLTNSPATSLTAYAVSRDAQCNFIANVSGAWTVTGSLPASDLAPSTGTSTTFTPTHCSASGALRVTVSGLTSVDSGTVTVNDAQPAPSVVYVDDSYGSFPNGTVVNWPYTSPGTNVIGCDAFVKIQDAIDRVAAGGRVYVAAGTYAQPAIVIAKAVTVLGPNAGKAGSDPTRGPEAIVTTEGNNPDDGQVFDLEASNITIDGLLVDGNGPQTGGVSVGGVDVNIAEAIQNGPSYAGPFAQIDHIVICNNKVRNSSYQGVYLEVEQGSSSSWNFITNNCFENMWEGVQVYAMHADISGNTFNSVNRGLSIHGCTAAAEAGFTPRIANNQVTLGPANTWPTPDGRAVGLWVNYRRGNAPALMVANNVINVPYAPPTGAYFMGIYCLTVDGDRSVTFANNIVNGYTNCARGFYATACSSPNVLVTGGVLAGITDYGVLAANNDPSWDANDTYVTVNNVNISMAGTGAGVAAVAITTSPYKAQVVVNGNSVISTGATGVLVQGAQAAASVLNNSASISGNGVGIDVDAGKALLENNDLTGNTEAGIRVQNEALVDAGDCSDSNLTHLGTGSKPNHSSAGLNKFLGYGFTTTDASWAIVNLNNTPSTVLADQNNFGAVAGDDVEQAFYSPNTKVRYSQNPEVLQCPTVSPVSCAGDVPAAATALTGFIYSANTGGTITTVVDSLVSSNSPNDFVLSRTYTVVDACGVSTSASQSITVKDLIAPTVDNPAGSLDVTLECDNAAGLTAALAALPTATDNCSGALERILESDVTTRSGSCANTYVQVRKWHFTDLGGNASATFTQTITVQDTQAPIITTLAGTLDRTVECDNNDALTAALALAPIATDNCTNAPAIHLASDVTTGSYPQYTRVRKWNFTDGCGNTSPEFVQTITVHDTTKPTFATFPTATTVDCAASVAPSATGTPTAQDNCDGSPVISHTDLVTTNGSGQVVNTITRHWTVTDAAGNATSQDQTITVQDTTPPNIVTCPTNRTLVVDSNCAVAMPNLAPEVGVLENCGYTITQDPAPGDPLGVAVYVVTVTVTDGGGNSTQCQLQVAVEDQTAPTISTLPADRTLLADATCQAAIPDLVAEVVPVAFDNCTPNLLLDIVQSPAAGTPVGLGKAVVTVYVSDEFGNTNSCQTTITVADQTAPVVNCPGAVLVATGLGNGNCSAVANWQPATATDNCTPANQIGIKYFLNYGQSGQVEVHSGDTFPVGTAVVTAEATDAASNQGTCTFNVVVTDDTLPVVQCKNITVNLGVAGTVTITAADVDNGSTDNCAVASRSVVPNTFTSANLGANPVVLTVADAQGNTASCNATVTVLPAADVSVVVAISANPATLGSNLTYTLSVSNAGSATAPSVLLSNYLGVGQLSLAVTNGLTGIGQGSPFPGPAAWWPAEGDASDVAGTNVGTLATGVTYVAGQVGQAFHFDGARGNISMPDSPSLRPASLTIEGWIRPQMVGGHRALIGKRLGSGTLDSYALWIDSDTVVAAVADNAGFGPTLTCVVASGQWVHVAYSFDAATGAQALYVNGALVDAGFASKVIAYDTHPVLLGTDNASGPLGSFYLGDIDEMALYNRALTGAEIKAICTAGSGGKCRTPGLLDLGTIPSGASVEVALVTAPTTCPSVSIAASASSTLLDPNLANNTATLTVPVVAIPPADLRLSLVPVSGHAGVLRLEWPSTSSPSELQSADSLNAPGSWGPSTLPVLWLEHGYGTIVPVSNGMKYFRVRTP